MSSKRNTIIIFALIFLVGFLFGLGRYFINRPSRVELEWNARMAQERQEALDAARAEFSISYTGFPTGFTNYEFGDQLNLGMNIDDIIGPRVSDDTAAEFRTVNNLPYNTILLGLARVHTVVFYSELNTVTGIATNSGLWMLSGGIRVGGEFELVIESEIGNLWDEVGTKFWITDELPEYIPNYSLGFTTNARGTITSILLLDLSEPLYVDTWYAPFWE